MIWFYLSLGTAIANSFKNIVSKKLLDVHNEYSIALGTRFYSILFLLPLLFFTRFETSKSLWIFVVIGGVLHIAATILFLKSLKYSDLSLSIPMLSFTPAFILLITPLMRQDIDAQGIVGVIIICIGSFILSKKANSFKINKGALLMLVVAFILAITSAVDVYGIRYSNPITWLICTNIFIALGLLPFVKCTRESLNLSILSIATITSVVFVLQMYAITMAPVSYVIAIKRTTIIFSVILGRFILKEENFKQRLLGSVIMVSGVVLIVI